MDVVKGGLRAIRNTYKILRPPIEAYIEAVKIYDLGHRDFVDAIHYTTALHTKMKWLTIGRSLVEIVVFQSLKQIQPFLLVFAF